MTHDEKITYMRISAGMCNFGMTEDQLDLLISLYEGVMKKKGKFDVGDAVRIKHEVQERSDQREIEEEKRRRINDELAKKRFKEQAKTM